MKVVNDVQLGRYWRRWQTALSDHPSFSSAALSHTKTARTVE